MDQGAAVEVTGPDESVESLFAVHFRAMTKLAGLLGADDPEDVAQEAFARMHQARRRMRDPDAALAYVRSTVCNLARSRRRHLSVVRRREPDLLPVSRATPEQSAVDRDENRRVIAALRSLSRRQQEVLVLRYWMEQSEADIADTLGISTGSVKTHASRGLAALERHLEGPS